MYSQADCKTSSTRRTRKARRTIYFERVLVRDTSAKKGHGILYVKDVTETVWKQNEVLQKRGNYVPNEARKCVFNMFSILTSVTFDYKIERLKNVLTSYNTGNVFAKKAYQIVGLIIGVFKLLSNKTSEYTKTYSVGGISCPCIFLNLSVERKIVNRQSTCIAWFCIRVLFWQTAVKRNLRI